MNRLRCVKDWAVDHIFCLLWGHEVNGWGTRCLMCGRRLK